MAAASLSHSAGRTVQSKKAANVFEEVWSRMEAKFEEDIPFPKRIIWLGGAPGAGKGTNAECIMQSCGISAKPIVVSSLLDSPEAHRIKAQGGLVDDAFVLEALLDELCKPEYRDGVVVDGFPRTAIQVQFLSSLQQVQQHCQFDIAVLDMLMKLKVFPAS